MVRNEIYLDLNKTNLFGIDDFSSLLVISAMRIGIRLGHKFPAINVRFKGDYFVVYNGQHRVLSHRMEGRKCLTILEEPCFLDGGGFLLSDIPLIDGKNIDAGNMYRLRNALNPLPKDVAERFCEEHGLNPEMYLPQ